MRDCQKGSSLVDILVGLLLVSLVLAGTLNSLVLQTRVHSREDLSLMLDQNLRRAIEAVTDDLRASGDGVPATNLDSWVPWVTGFTSNPKVETGDDPALTVARCTSLPVAEVDQGTASGDTLVALAPRTSADVADELDDSGHRLILIGDSETALITGLSGNRIQIDTDPTSNGSQGLSRSYPPGTPIRRVNVVTYRLVDPGDGRSVLAQDNNDGSGWTPVADGITELRVTTLENGRRFRITVTANSQAADPLSGEDLSRTISSVVFVRNADRQI